MKILVVNRNYFVTGGPEKYMFSLMENMPQHQFVPFCVDFQQNRATPFSKYFVRTPASSESVYYTEFKMSPLEKARYALDSINHSGARRNLEKLIQDERPSLALFLNAVYFSDSIIDACRAHDIPIIWRMSDFHKVCANYLLYRDGNVCEDCLKHGLHMAIFNRCGGYQRSTGAALIKVAGMWLSRIRRRYDHVDFFVTPSAFTRKKMIEGGFCAEKIIHIPTWTSLSNSHSNSLPSSLEVLYVGRLSHEKGVEILLKAFRILKNKDAQLNIVGDDTTVYAKQLKEVASDELGKRIRFLGFQNQEQIAELFQRATCFVVPSVWYENQPNVVLEGMAHGRPAVVSDLGSLREMVEHGKTGYRFEAGNEQDLAEKIDDLLHTPKRAREMGACAKEYIAEHHSMRGHLDALEDLFQKCAVRI